MNWVILLLVSTLTLPGFAKQESNARGLISRQSLSEKNVRLDPLLRRALLRALTELEKEAQEKVRAEEARYARSEQHAISGDFVKTAQEEIQNTPDSNYPSQTPNNIQSTPLNEELREANRFRENVEPTSPATQQGPFIYQTQSSQSVGDEDTSVQESKGLNPTANPSEIVSNLISDTGDKEKNSVEKTAAAENENIEKKEEADSKAEEKKTTGNENEVDIFKAPLVAAFTLHQDSRGTPHSVIPLFRKEPQDSQRQQLLQQQYQLYQQQQQQQQFLQNQFIPNLAITPLSQSNQFSQPQRFFSGTVAPSFASSTVFPPLVSNSILPQSFPSSVLPAQGFQPSTTLAPFRTNHQNFLSTLAPQRNLPPQSFQSTLLPPQDFSVVQSHNFNFSPTPQPSFQAATTAPSQGLQPISIPPVTLPLQNEPRFQAPIIVPSLPLGPDQTFINHDQRLRNQFLIEEQNRQRLIEEQNRQRQIEEENKQKQIEEQNRQRQLEEQNRQRQIEEQRQRQQLEELNRQRQIEEERNRLLLGQNLRQQRQEQGVDFQRSVGFSFNQNFQGSPKVPNNAFSFNIQPSQSFAHQLNFGDVESRNRVNRQEAFGSTGNLGVVNNQAHRNFPTAQNQFQSNQIFSNFQNPQEYRTIPDEHYRNLQINQFQQANRFQQFRPNNFQQNNVQDVNKQLQKLLYQSGVASDVSGQEDLNIVSKVLALNHERSDTNVDETIIRNERRVDDPSEKSLGVGEIKDVQVTTEFIKPE